MTSPALVRALALSPPYTTNKSYFLSKKKKAINSREGENLQSEDSRNGGRIVENRNIHMQFMIRKPITAEGQNVYHCIKCAMLSKPKTLKPNP